MTRLLAISLALTISVSCFGQKTNKQTITLNDGSLLIGVIVADSADMLTLKLDSPQTIKLSKQQIKSYELHPQQMQYYSRTKGYYIHFASSVLAGKNDWRDVYNLSIQLSNGYQLSNGVRVGIGTGIENMEVPLIPLFADINYHPINSRISPYLYLRSGYSFALIPNEETYYIGYYYNPIADTKGGFLFNAGAGIALYTWDRAAINLGVGYRYQEVTVYRHYDMWGGSSTLEMETFFHRIELQLGFVFR
jgi:hypothetical protein